jgi:hypothetical protein
VFEQPELEALFADLASFADQHCLMDQVMLVLGAALGEEDVGVGASAVGILAPVTHDTSLCSAMNSSMVSPDCP